MVVIITIISIAILCISIESHSSAIKPLGEQNQALVHFKTAIVCVLELEWKYSILGCR